MIARVGATLGLGLAGVVVFNGLGLPLPWLLGPMFACLIAALAGAPLEAPPRASAVMRTVLGVAVGAAVTPELLQRLPGMAISVALIPLFILVTVAVGAPYFRRVCGFDRTTAWFSAMPGGFQDVVLLGEAAGGDPRALSLVHATRVLAIVAIMPRAAFGALGPFAGTGRPASPRPRCRRPSLRSCWPAPASAGGRR